MALVLITCPTTGRKVPTGISLDRESWADPARGPAPGVAAARGPVRRRDGRHREGRRGIRLSLVRAAASVVAFLLIVLAFAAIAVTFVWDANLP